MMMHTDINMNKALCLNCEHLSDSRLENCSICDTILYQRKQNSFTRTLALIISALFFFIPANYFSVMKTVSYLNYENNTIFEGIYYFLEHGEYFIAIILFMASIVIPIFKFIILFYLLYSVKIGSKWKRGQKTTLYNIIHKIGKWSMLDIFVIGLMISLVQFGDIAIMSTGYAAISFAMMVVLTMFATESFDTRLLWDEGKKENE